MKIKKHFNFEASHKLVRHEGKCANLHGHSYKVEVSLRGGLQTSGSAEGMVMDFSDLKKEVKFLIDNFDHAFIEQGNEGIIVNTKKVHLGIRTTAENMALFFYWYLAVYKRIEQIEHVRIWETATGYAQCDYEDYRLEVNRETNLNELFKSVYFEDSENGVKAFNVNGDEM